VDIGIPPLLLGSSLNLIIAQRLVRKMCQKCKKEYQPPAEVLELLHLDKISNPKFFRGEGCVACNGTGYSGRIGIFEIMVISRELRTMIVRNCPTMEIQQQAEKEGMKTLRKAGMEMALNGITTLEQVMAATMEI
jgi:type IV pilus assembly protein PilB